MANRITQLPTEVLTKPSTQSTRVTQTAIEVTAKPSTQSTRVTQTAIEVTAKPVTQKIHLTQIAIEIITHINNCPKIFKPVVYPAQIPCMLPAQIERIRS
ncbi:MAG: hypothetical protein QXF82_00780 [Nitrososphaeria archaeon]